MNPSTPLPLKIPEERIRAEAAQEQSPRDGQTWANVLNSFWAYVNMRTA